MTTKFRSLYTIASEIRKDWKPIHVYAREYVGAMSSLDSINDKYICDSGREIVARFLNAASTWRGEKAREIKKELNAMLKSK
jgi:hypothetical protein